MDGRVLKTVVRTLTARYGHPTLGAGVVLDMEGDGDEARLTVFFEKSGKRKLVAKFANLEML